VAPVIRRPLAAHRARQRGPGHDRRPAAAQAPRRGALRGSVGAAPGARRARLARAVGVSSEDPDRDANSPPGRLPVTTLTGRSVAHGRRPRLPALQDAYSPPPAPPQETAPPVTSPSVPAPRPRARRQPAAASSQAAPSRA